MNSRRGCRWALWGAFLCCLALAWPAASLAAGKGPLDEPSAYLIKLQKDPRGGKSAFLKGMATQVGANLKLKSLWATQAVKLVLKAEDKSRPLKMEVRRFHWKKPSRVCSTGRDGICSLSFRNQGDVFIRLISPAGPAKVYLGVRVKEQLEQKMKPVLVGKGGKK